MGYEKDLARTLWPFRDWLIQAFNDGMPYDEWKTQFQNSASPEEVAAFEKVMSDPNLTS